MQSAKNQKTKIGFAKDKLHFILLPDYAKFLLENKLEEFATTALKVYREIEIPLLQYFSHLTEKELTDLSVHNSKVMLSHFAENRVRDFINQAISGWKQSQLSSINSDDLMVRDVATVSFVRRKMFRDFLPQYTNDLSVYIGIMEEVDRFTVTQEEMSYTFLFELKQQKINENFQQLLEAQQIAGLGSFDWDLTGGESFYSPQTLEIFGLAENRSLDSFMECVHPSDRKKLKESINKALTGDGEYECEYRYRKSGVEKVIWSRGRVSFRNGVAQRMKGTIMDVTQRHDMLKLLERSEELNKQAQALTNIGNWTWYIPENKLSWSDELYRIYGLEPQSEEITPEKSYSFIHPEDREKRKAAINEAIETGKMKDYTMRILSRDGSMKIIQGKGTVLADENNKPYKLLGTCQDITQQYILTAQLAEKNAELERSNQELTSFNYIASHDLQEPLRKIRTYSGRIIEKYHALLPHDAKDYFDRMNNAAARMQKLIDDLLAFSRTASTEKVFETTDLNSLLEDVKNSLRHLIDEKKAVIRSGVLPKLDVIPFQFRQLLENIIHNAIKFTQPELQPIVTISVSESVLPDTAMNNAGPGKKYCHISISDNGIGFNQQYAKRIFELFQRLHGKSEYAGTGIGLAICKKIVENHHGFIEASGEEGKGSTFDIYIPV